MTTRRAQALMAGTVLVTTCFAATMSSAALPTNFADQSVVTGLSQPAGMAFLPDGRMLIIEQKTRNVRLVLAGGATADTTLIIADVNTSGNERGLLGMAIDPQWPTRPNIYFYFDQTPSIKNYIVRYTATGDLSNGASSNLTLGSRYNIMTDIPDAASNHNGGTLRFGIDGKLYASLGEDADACGAQNNTLLKGNILRLDIDNLPAGAGGPPAKSLITPVDNPFVGSANANTKLVFAFGLRNPFRFQIDSLTGILYIADVGQNTFEEIDECDGGENFGWPNFEGNAFFSGTCPAASPVGPIATYDRTGFASASIISGPRYRRVCGGLYTFPADYEGDVFYSEYYQGFLRRLRNTAGTWAPAPGAPGQPNANDWATATTNVSDYAIGPDGAIYYCKQFTAGIRRIVYTGLQPAGMVPTVMASAVSSSRIDITWSAPPNGGAVVSYDVECRIPPAAFALRANVPSGTTAYADTGLMASTIYEYRILAKNAAGAWGYSGTASDSTLTQSGVGDPAPRPAILTAFPNPFRSGGGVTIRAEAVNGSPLTLRVFDTAGRRIRDLSVAATRNDVLGGPVFVTWDGRNDDGRQARPGVYFLRFEAGGRVATHRLVLAGP
ncbi:MAG: PQQ-dependent sugar dehydrogenase [Candidatus Eisenbacteria bacterium]|nr:PQQ-dependent sugar dehydrogenase [Candidatus Eisenbacteria bacterium]